VNLQQASRFRARHAVSHAKSDAGDAHVLADTVRTDSRQLCEAAGDSAEAAALKVLARTHKTTSQRGMGMILGARVLAKFGDDPARYRDGKARRNYAATSPITRAYQPASSAAAV
jgi:hypothetical protein